MSTITREHDRGLSARTDDAAHRRRDYPASRSFSSSPSASESDAIVKEASNVDRQRDTNNAAANKPVKLTWRRPGDAARSNVIVDTVR